MEKLTEIIKRNLDKDNSDYLDKAIERKKYVDEFMDKIEKYFENEFINDVKLMLNCTKPHVTRKDDFNNINSFHLFIFKVNFMEQYPFINEMNKTKTLSSIIDPESRIIEDELMEKYKVTYDEYIHGFISKKLNNNLRDKNIHYFNQDAYFKNIEISNHHIRTLDFVIKITIDVKTDKLYFK